MTTHHRTTLVIDSARCWCGVRRPYFSDEPFEEGCGGSGLRLCFCGGDLCVCHWHGEVQCDGCQDCNYGDPDDEWEFDA